MYMYVDMYRSLNLEKKTNENCSPWTWEPKNEFCADILSFVFWYRRRSGNNNNKKVICYIHSLETRQIFVCISLFPHDIFGNFV